MDKFQFLRGTWNINGLDLAHHRRSADQQLKPVNLHGEATFDIEFLSDSLVVSIEGGVGFYYMHCHVMHKAGGDYVAYSFSAVPAIVEYIGHWSDDNTIVVTSTKEYQQGLTQKCFARQKYKVAVSFSSWKYIRRRVSSGVSPCGVLSYQQDLFSYRNAKLEKHRKVTNQRANDA